MMHGQQNINVIMNVHYIVLHVKYVLGLSVFVKFELPRQILEKSSNIRLLENPYSGSRVFPCGEMEGRTDMTQLTVANRNLANAPKNINKQIASDTS
jgi:hypothetical protein